MIIDQGRLLFDGTLNFLSQKFSSKRRLVVDFAEVYSEIHIEGAEVVAMEGQQITFQFERGLVTASDLIGRISQRYRIMDLQVLEPKIEDTIRRIYEERLLHSQV